MLSTSRHSIPCLRVLFDRRTRLDDPYLLKRGVGICDAYFRPGEKYIKTEAVNLAPLFYRVPLAMPYWNGAVYRSVLHSLCSGRVIDGADLDDLRSRLVQELAVEDAILCGSGSLALEIALRACKVARGDEVVIPTFCCTAVVAPILATGATPVLADVGEELNLTVETVRPVLTQKTRAIIVPHLFGNPADIEGIAELAARKNIRVIDDAAQALGATIDGRPVGSFGAAGILSFGNEKVCFGLGGGVAIFRDKKLLPNDSAVTTRPSRSFCPRLENSHRRCARGVGAG